MRSVYLIPAVACLSLSISSGAVAGEAHRLLLLDGLEGHGARKSRVLLAEVESGKVLASVEAGTQAVVGLSQDGAVVGVISNHIVADNLEPKSRAAFYRTTDLSLIQTGYLPVHRTSLMVSGGYFTFSPDGQEFLVQRMESYLNDEKPGRHTVDECWVTRVRRELDEEGVFQVAGKPVKVPRCRQVTFLRLKDWPRVHVFNPHLGALEVLDLEAGEIVSKMPIYDDPTLEGLEPAELEQPNIGQRILSLRSRGAMATLDGGLAYYVPTQLRGRRDPRHLMTIDLAADPPNTVRKSTILRPDLRAGTSVVSPAGAIFVAQQVLQGAYIQPSRRIMIFSTLDLSFLNEIDLSTSDCNRLAASSDGKYVYALSSREAKVAVIDVASGREIKVLDGMGELPVTILSVPQRDVTD